MHILKPFCGDVNNLSLKLYIFDYHMSATGYVGPMRSGKSSALVNNYKLAVRRWSKEECLLLKPAIDTRCQGVSTHDGIEIEAVTISNITDIQVTPSIKFIGIDEIQFFDEDIAYLVRDWRDHGIRVVFAGLDMGHTRDPFVTTAKCMAVADHINKLRAICDGCANDAIYTKKKDMSLPNIGNHYNSVCFNCS